MLAIRAYGAQQDAAAGMKIGDEFAVAGDGQSGGMQATPAVAHGTGGVYLVVWREGSAAEGGGARIMAGVVSGNTGSVKAFAVAPVPSSDAPQLYPRVAFCGKTFLVVWQDFRNGKDNDILAARVSLDGKVMDPEPLKIAAGPGTQASPDVAANGDGFLVVFQSHPDSGTVEKYASCAVPVSVDGKTGALCEVIPFSCSPRVTSNGSNYLVAAGLNSVKCRLVGPDGRVLKGEQNIFINNIPEVSLAAEPGGGWLVVNHRSRPDYWGWSGPAAERFLCLTADLKQAPGWPPRNDYPKGKDGEPNWLDGKWVEGKSLGVPYGPSACAWDGRSFVVVWQRFRQTVRGFSVMLDKCDLIAGRVEGWQLKDGQNGVPLAGSDGDEITPALASDGHGGLLCVYAKKTPEGILRVMARTIR